MDEWIIDEDMAADLQAMHDSERALYMASVAARMASTKKGRQQFADLARKDGKLIFARKVLSGCWDRRSDVAAAIANDAQEPTDDIA